MALYTINIRWIKTPFNPELVDAQLSRTLGVLDWLKYNGYTWIVNSTISAQQLQGALMQLLSTEDSVLVLKADLADISGWVPKLAVDWVSKYQ